MLLPTTLIVLAIWLAFVWFVDPDRMRRDRALSINNRNAVEATNALKPQ